MFNVQQASMSRAVALRMSSLRGKYPWRLKELIVMIVSDVRRSCSASLWHHIGLSSCFHGNMRTKCRPDSFHNVHLLNGETVVSI